MAKPAEEKPNGGTLVHDPELIALAKIGKLLGSLDAETRQRVIAWVNAKYPATKEVRESEPC